MIKFRGKEYRPVSDHRVQKEGKEYAIYAVPNGYFSDQNSYQIMSANKSNPFNPYIAYISVDLEDAVDWMIRVS